MEGIVLLWRKKPIPLCLFTSSSRKKIQNYNKNGARGISPHSLLISSMLASSASLHKVAAWFGESDEGGSGDSVFVTCSPVELHKIAVWFGESDVGGSGDSVFLTCSPVERARSIHCYTNLPKN